MAWDVTTQMLGKVAIRAVWTLRHLWQNQSGLVEALPISGKRGEAGRPQRAIREEIKDPGR
jgi:hypothetical protein